MAASGEKPFEAFGTKYVFHVVPYDGAVTTFDVDQTATVATVVDPASGPAVTLGSASGGLKTATVAAGGSHNSGTIVVVTRHGKSVASSGR
jgi:hypothetical protein